MNRRLLPPLAALLCVAGPASAQALRVGPDAAYSTVGEALARAGSGDTVRVAAGVYRERLRITRPVTLIGEGWPVLDAGGHGHVVEALARIDLRGFVLRGSGTSVEREDAGVMVRGATARIVGNRLDDVLYGVYLKQAAGSVVAGNRVRGKPLAPPRRGDGIRLWYSSGTRISGNEVRGVRDVVVYFSDRVLIQDNIIVDGRYGLHSMYSDHGRITGNRLEGNQVGAFLMYSTDLDLERNVFADGSGPSGMGLGLKDSDRVTLRDNLFLENSIGVHLDNSPRARDGANVFEGNVFALNGAGVLLMPSVSGNRFHKNDFLANDVPARVAGGSRPGQVDQNDWSGNHWSDYAGFDRSGDGIGDTPYVHAHLADELIEKHPGLRIFTLSPALGALDALARFFPLLRPAPVVADPLPRLSPSAASRWQVEWRERGRGSGPAGRAAAAVAWVVAGGTAVLILVAGTRRGRRPR